MRAILLFEENLALWQELGNKGGAAIAFNALGDQYFYLGDNVRAAAHYKEALVLSRAARDEDLAGMVLCNLGLVALARGDDTQARELVEEGVALLRERTFWGIFWALHALAYVLTAQGEYVRARALLSESLRLLRPIRATWLITHCLEHFAGLESRELRPKRVARLYGAAETLREAIGRPRYPRERADHERDLASARAMLDPAAFAATWERGRRMTLDEAIEYALQES